MAEEGHQSRSARRHEEVRQQNANELAQDYVEAIHELRRRLSKVRVMDLQEVFGVSHVTVIRTLQRLERQELVERTRRGGITLTPTGARMAEEAAKRHALVVKFLRALGVEEQQAKVDAEGIEHHLSGPTIAAFERFLKGNGG